MTIPNVPRIPRGSILQCTYPGCDRPFSCKGYCSRHYRWFKNTGRVCSIEGCEQQHECKGYCKVHYWRFRTHGDPHVVKLEHGHGKTRKEKFWSRVDKTPGFGPNGDCWKWTGKPTPQGYGMVSVNGSAIPAHRASWLYTYGEMPKLWLLHSCDNPRCVNPAHLREGTPADNAADMVKRDRQSKGERRPNAKLTDADILAIRAAPSVWGIQTKLAKQYDVPTSSINRIRKGLIWTHVQ